jgi:hypothetical protein
VDNIKMDLRGIGWGGMDQMDLTQVRGRWRALVNTAMNLRVTYNVGKFSNSCTTSGNLRKAELCEEVTPYAENGRYIEMYIAFFPLDNFELLF